MLLRALVAAAAVAALACPSALAAGRPDLHTPAAGPASGPAWPLTSPGGPFLRDSYGRAVILHGVNVVYKYPPYEVMVGATGQPYDFTAADAAEIASLGFDVVRVGVLWEGLEPGKAGSNDPAICTPGAPAGNDQYDAAALDSYAARVKDVVALLASYGVASLIDMHQDVYSQAFQGEGAPAWAVCTNGLPVTNTGNWQANYFEPAVAAAYDNFWTNDVIGDLQGSYDRAFTALAAQFRGDPWVVGYDLYNEPYSAQVFVPGGSAAFDDELQCFYAGRAHPGTLAGGAPAVCPPDDPEVGLTPALEKADPGALMFYEPDLTDNDGNVDVIGSMPFPDLVLNFHDYCLTGNVDVQLAAGCAPQEQAVISEQSAARGAAAGSTEPGGPAWFMSEFGPSAMGSDPSAADADITRMTGYADEHLLGWTYYAWKAYGQFTGAPDVGLVNPTGTLDLARAAILSRTYAEAVAGTPTAMSFDPSSGEFHLTYVPGTAIHAPTVVFVPVSLHYPHGYCAAASGARLTSPTGAERLTLSNLRGFTQVSLTVSPGACPR